MIKTQNFVRHPAHRNYYVTKMVAVVTQCLIIDSYFVMTTPGLIGHILESSNLNLIPTFDKILETYQLLRRCNFIVCILVHFFIFIYEFQVKSVGVPFRWQDVLQTSAFSTSATQMLHVVFSNK